MELPISDYAAVFRDLELMPILAFPAFSHQAHGAAQQEHGPWGPLIPQQRR